MISGMLYTGQMSIQARYPSCQPINNVRALKRKKALEKSPTGVIRPSSTNALLCRGAALFMAAL